MKTIIQILRYRQSVIKYAKRHGISLQCVQTDNGFEFTNRFSRSKRDLQMLFEKAATGLGIRHKLIRPYTPRHNGKKTLFERKLQEQGIGHKLIRPYTPRHNGKVERSHRKDNEYFYASHTFYSLKDFAAQLAAHNRRYNNFPMRPLGWKSPRETMEAFHSML